MDILIDQVCKPRQDKQKRTHRTELVVVEKWRDTIPQPAPISCPEVGWGDNEDAAVALAATQRDFRCVFDRINGRKLPKERKAWKEEAKCFKLTEQSLFYNQKEGYPWMTHNIAPPDRPDSVQFSYYERHVLKITEFDPDDAVWIYNENGRKDKPMSDESLQQKEKHMVHYMNHFFAWVESEKKYAYRRVDYAHCKALDDEPIVRIEWLTASELANRYCQQKHLVAVKRRTIAMVKDEQQSSEESEEEEEQQTGKKRKRAPPKVEKEILKTKLLTIGQIFADSDFKLVFTDHYFNPVQWKLTTDPFRQYEVVDAWTKRLNTFGGITLTAAQADKYWYQVTQMLCNKDGLPFDCGNPMICTETPLRGAWYLEFVDENHDWYGLDGIAFGDLVTVYELHPDRPIVKGVPHVNSPNWNEHFEALCGMQRMMNWKYVNLDPPGFPEGYFDKYEEGNERTTQRFFAWFGSGDHGDYYHNPLKEMGVCIAPYLDFLFRIVCRGDRKLFEYRIDWEASFLQYLGVTMQSVLVNVGDQGNGKNFATAVLGSLVGKQNYMVLHSTDDIVGDFTSALAGVLLIVIDEATFTHKGYERLKAMVTSSEFRNRQMYHDVLYATKFFNLEMNSNNQERAIPVGPSERRISLYNYANLALGRPLYMADLHNAAHGDGKMHGTNEEAKIHNAGPVAKLYGHYLYHHKITPGFSFGQPIVKSFGLRYMQLSSLKGMSKWLYEALFTGVNIPRSELHGWNEELLAIQRYTLALRALPEFKNTPASLLVEQGRIMYYQGVGGDHLMGASIYANDRPDGVSELDWRKRCDDVLKRQEWSQIIAVKQLDWYIERWCKNNNCEISAREISMVISRYCVEPNKPKTEYIIAPYQVRNVRPGQIITERDHQEITSAQRERTKKVKQEHWLLKDLESCRKIFMVEHCIPDSAYAEIWTKDQMNNDFFERNGNAMEVMLGPNAAEEEEVVIGENDVAEEDTTTTLLPAHSLFLLYPKKS